MLASFKSDSQFKKSPIGFFLTQSISTCEAFMDKDIPKVVVSRTPSTSYASARASSIYQLSELMFGSLLAAYILGFLNFAATSGAFATANASETLLFALHIFIYLCICLTFAYATAGMYLFYHVSILTAPNLPVSRLRFDFLIALSQAICFGFSMLFPTIFPLLISIVYIGAQIRKYYEWLRMSDDWMFDYFGKKPSLNSPEPKKKEDKKEFRSFFYKILREEGFRKLSMWAPPSKKVWCYVIILFLCGLTALLLEDTALRVIGQEALLGALSLLHFSIFCIIYSVSGKVMTNNADFMTDKKKHNELDEVYKQLLTRLSEWEKIQGKS